MLRQQYITFIREYEAMGHMDKIPISEIDISWNQFFHLPHQSVHKESSTRTNLRVLFDGSAKTNTGPSLNDNLFSGSTIQQTLHQIITRFHLHKFVVTGDLEKMLRQILDQLSKNIVAKAVKSTNSRV